MVPPSVSGWIVSRTTASRNGLSVWSNSNSIAAPSSAGVNGGVVSLDGRGETQLARATADGVREPLNRRATVDINF